MLKCKDVAASASDYLRDELPWYKKLPWYLHLAMCHNCRRFINKIKLTVAMSHRLRPPESDAETVDKIVSEVEKCCADSSLSANKQQE